MAKLGDLSYDTNEFDKDAKRGGGKLAPGSYNVEIVKTEQKPWDDGTISITLHCKVLDGENEGKLHYFRFNVVHKNEKAQGIARSSLNRVCDLVDVAWPLTDDEQLVGGVFRLDLSYNAKGYPVENTDEYVSDVPSEVTGVAPVGKPGANGAAATSGQAGAGATANGGAAAPW